MHRPTIVVHPRADASRRPRSDQPRHSTSWRGGRPALPWRPAVQCALVACLAVAACPVPLGATPFTIIRDESQFTAALGSSYFIDTFSGMTPGAVSATFVRTGSTAGTSNWSYTADTTGIETLIVLDGSGASNRWISTNAAEKPLTFTSFTPANYAFGGRFFFTDLNEAVQSGTVSLEIRFVGDSTTYTVTTNSSPNDFVGIVSTGDRFESVTLVAPTTGSGNYATASMVIVPEPSTLAGLLIGGSLLGVLAWRSRSTVARVVCLVVLLSGLVGPVQTGWAAPPPPKKPPANAVRKPDVKPILEQAVRLRGDGKPDEALDLLRKAVRDVKAAGGEESPELTGLYDLATDLLMETEDYEKAEGLLEKAIGLRETLLDAGDDSQLEPLATTWLRLSAVVGEAGRFADSCAAAGHAVKLLDSWLGPDDDSTRVARSAFDAACTRIDDMLGPEHELARAARMERAELELALGRSQDAVAILRTAVDTARATDGSDAAGLRDGARRLTRLLVATGFAAETLADQEHLVAEAEAAEKAARDAEDGRDREAVLRLVTELELLGEIALAAERFSVAVDAFDRAVDAGRYAMPEDHPDHRLLRLRALHARAVRGDPSVGRQVVDSVAHVSGSEDEPNVSRDALRILTAAARVLDVTGDHVAARDCVNRARDAEAYAGDVAAEDFIDARAVAGRVHLAMDDPEAAAPPLEEAAAEADRTFGPGHPRTQAIMIDIVRCALAADDVAAAREYAEGLLLREVVCPDPRSEESLVEVFDRLSHAAPGDEQAVATTPEGVEPSFVSRLIALRDTQFGSTHPRAALIRLLGGDARLAAGDAATALSRFDEALPMIRSAFGDDHPEFAAALMVQARALVGVDRPADAERSLRTSLTIWDAQAGPTHAATRAAVQMLAALLVAGDRTADALPLVERIRVGLESDADAPDLERAAVLVQLATLHAKQDGHAAVKQLLAEALDIDCWSPHPAAAEAETEDLALRLADIARLYREAGDATAATATLRQARGLATRLTSPRDVLERIEEIATGN